MQPRRGRPRNGRAATWRSSGFEADPVFAYTIDMNRWGHPVQSRIGQSYPFSSSGKGLVQCSASFLDFGKTTSQRTLTRDAPRISVLAQETISKISMNESLRSEFALHQRGNAGKNCNGESKRPRRLHPSPRPYCIKSGQLIFKMQYF